MAVTRGKNHGIFTLWVEAKVSMFVRRLCTWVVPPGVSLNSGTSDSGPRGWDSCFARARGGCGGPFKALWGEPSLGAPGDRPGLTICLDLERLQNHQ